MRITLALSALALCVCYSLGSFSPSKVALSCGENVGKHVCLRVRQLLRSVAEVRDFEDNVLRDAASTLILAVGNSSIANGIIDQKELAELGSEGYIVRTGFAKTVRVLAANGNPLSDEHATVVPTDVIHLGAVFATYAALEQLGFGFLHPLKPTIPAQLMLRSTRLNVVEKPYWKFRGFHIHTMHPLELTDVLQGFDVPFMGPHHIGCHKRANATGNLYCEKWEHMVDDVDRMFEWAVANKQNRIEWIILGSVKWGDLTDGDLRKSRLQKLTQLGHSYGLILIADVPVALKQQHAWYMVNTRDPWEAQVEEIHTRVDWLFEAGFDALATESGLSEFTHPSCQVMLNLLNEVATYGKNKYGREVAVKVHCSTGQKCPDFPDPRTGEPINFNFLPTYADPALGVMPHTVQAYAVDDPTAGSYGNDNFTYMMDYMFYEAHQKARSVVWHPETAYWVNVDVDVPLFLPIYGQRRLHDLRIIAEREIAENVKIDGQMVFDSGWEWGYWLSDVITARASWNPLMDIKDENKALAVLLQPFTNMLPKEIADQLVAFLDDLIDTQSELMIHGRVDGKESVDLHKLSGFAYMSGADTWVDLPRLLGLSFTQPDKVHMNETSDPLYPHVLPLLSAMEQAFADLSSRMSDIHATAIQAKTAAGPLELIAELDDAVKMLAFRSALVRTQYQSLSPDTDEALRAMLLSDGRSILAEAQQVVLRREANYRVPWQRIADWHLSPTVYRYGYIWAVHTLYYWWRDQGLAEGGSLEARVSPCYLNRIDAPEVPFGWGKYAMEALRIYLTDHPDHPDANLIVNCLAPPPKPYEFPRDLFAY